MVLQSSSPNTPFSEMFLIQHKGNEECLGLRKNSVHVLSSIYMHERFGDQSTQRLSQVCHSEVCTHFQIISCHGRQNRACKFDSEFNILLCITKLWNIAWEKSSLCVISMKCSALRAFNIANPKFVSLLDWLFLCVKWKGPINSSDKIVWGTFNEIPQWSCLCQQGVAKKAEIKRQFFYLSICNNYCDIRSDKEQLKLSTIGLCREKHYGLN